MSSKFHQIYEYRYGCQSAAKAQIPPRSDISTSHLIQTKPNWAELCTSTDLATRDMNSNLTLTLGPAT